MAVVSSQPRTDVTQMICSDDTHRLQRLLPPLARGARGSSPQGTSHIQFLEI